MAINKTMRAALKALSFPDIDLKKAYKLQRIVQSAKTPLLTKPLYSMWNHKVYCNGREVLVRLYAPEKPDEKNVLLFFHGGGWVTENIDTYNSVCKTLARQTQCRVVSVEYKLAPENPFPSGLEDCYAVAKDVIQLKQLFGVGDINVTLIGDSAGANLAAAVSMLARDKGEFKVKNQILLYPAVYNDYSDQSPFKSVSENGNDYLLTAKHLREYMELYIPDPEQRNSPYAAPLLAENLSDLPRTLIITAEYDPLRDEGETYGIGLRRAGNNVEIYRIRDALHGFFGLPIRSPQVKEAYNLINKFIYNQ